MLVMSRVIYMVTTVIISAAGTLATFWAMYNFASFCWNPWRSSHVTEDVIWSLFVDLLLVATFVLQHSGMKSPFLKNVLAALRLQVLERSLYVLSSSLVLLVDDGRLVGTVRAAFHALSWLVIYFGCFIFDIADILGIKQVYYDLCGMNDPAYYRGRAMCRFLSHYRHPSFTAFCVLFWFQSFMTLDRLLLAVYMTCYMGYSWNLDEEDFRYHKTMLKNKFVPDF